MHPIPRRRCPLRGVFEDQDLDSLHVNKVIQNVVQSPGDSHIVTSVPVLVEFSVGSVIYESIALIDDGADLSILGSNHLSRFLVPDSEKLSSDIKITLADGETTSNVLFGFYSDIVLHTAAGPLMARKQCFNFVEYNLPHVILGRPLLKNIGIDVENQLCQLACVETKSQQFTTPHSKHSNVTEVHSDEIHIPDIITNNIEIAISEALSKLLSECADNGASAEFVARFRSLLFEYSDIFRVSLGLDPPALVTPLKLEVVPDAVPVMTKPRRLVPSAYRYVRNLTK